MSPDVLLAGSIGALSVFLLGVVRDRVRRRRELRGMARLVHTEITRNHLALSDFYETLERVLSPVLNTVSTDTWESVRVRLAEMMPANDFGSIVYYYLFLQGIMDIPAIVRGGTRKSALELITNQLGVLEKQEPDAMAVALAYANLTGVRGWSGMRRSISTYRKGVAGAKEARNGDDTN